MNTQHEPGARLHYERKVIDKIHRQNVWAAIIDVVCMLVFAAIAIFMVVWSARILRWIP